MFERCHFCRKPLGADFTVHTYVERVTRRRAGDEREVDVKRVRAFHDQCLAACYLVPARRERFASTNHPLDARRRSWSRAALISAMRASAKRLISGPIV